MICPRCGQQIDSFPCPNCGFPETLYIKQTEHRRRSNMITTKRKAISILLAIMMMVAFAPPAFAFAGNAGRRHGHGRPASPGCGF